MHWPWSIVTAHCITGCRRSIAVVCLFVCFVYKTAVVSDMNFLFFSSRARKKKKKSQIADNVSATQPHKRPGSPRRHQNQLKTKTELIKGFIDLDVQRSMFIDSRTWLTYMAQVFLNDDNVLFIGLAGYQEAVCCCITVKISYLQTWLANLKPVQLIGFTC